MLAKWAHRIPLDSTFALVSLLLLGRLQIAYCQAGGDRTTPSADVLQAVQDELATITDVFAKDIANQFSFCIRDPKKDWNDAFNFSSDLGFVSNCILQTNGDLITRLCTKAEIKFYLSNLYRSKEINFFSPNKNCNLTSWLPGCEPGWACSVGKDQKTSPADAADHMPSRTIDCHTCCEGFFCPHGITCMILEQEPDHVSYDVSKLKDLSNRRTPGILVQYKYYLGRVTKQRLREAKAQGIDFLILGLAGICLGTITGVNDESIGAAGYTYTIIAVSLLCQIGSLKSFSLERLQYWRERESGMSSLAYFLSRDTVDHVNTVIKPIVYLLMFYFFTNPRSSIADNYVILIALIYCVTGIGYTFAICFQAGSAQLWSALFPVVLTLLATQDSSPQLLANLCYPKWALEAFIIINAERYSGVWLITRCGALHKSRYDINHWSLCIAILFLYGVVFRIVAFISMVLLQKKGK